MVGRKIGRTRTGGPVRTMVVRSGVFLILMVTPLLATCAPRSAAPGPPSAATLPPLVAPEPLPPDPELAGAFPVGVMTVPVESVSVTTGQVRRTRTVIWYPAVEAARRTTPDPDLRAALNAPLAQGMFPVVVFSHAAASTPTQSTFLTRHLASHGFVVAAPVHPGSTFEDCLGCGSPERQRQLLADSAVNRPAEVSGALDLLARLDEDPLSQFFGSLDVSRAGLLGHSWGGHTAVVGADRDTRFRAAIAMAPVADAEAMAAAVKLTTPTMVMASRLDDITPYPPQEQLFNGLRERTPRMLVLFTSGGHTAYSESCPSDAPGCRPGELGEDQAHRLVQGYVLAFLRRYVANDLRYTRYLNDAFGGDDVEVTTRNISPRPAP